MDVTSIDLCKDENILQYFKEEESMLSKIESIKLELLEEWFLGFLHNERMYIGINLCKDKDIM